VAVTRRTRVHKEQHWRYRGTPDAWDEVLEPGGLPRPHWRSLTSEILRMGREELDRRWTNARQLIHNNGITYNVYGDNRGKESLWSLDPLPFVLSEDDWALLAPAVEQRAKLLNLLLDDFYGPQHLLKRNLFPTSLVHANPAFLRPCFGTPVAGGIRLHIYAVDLVRSPDGRWWVLTDRAQAPSGAGYALENRLVSARTLPNVFSQCSVRPLRQFFEARRDGLQALAPGARRIVLLTPGPYNETFFEHSYLSRFWGISLVEGADLTVRENRVFLKTLSGLEQVDLILRRQDDAWCDPLELRGDSLLGVPGLLSAVRAGNVVVANALGSGVVESPAQLAFLPSLCRHLLDEDLRLPSLATWWCGQEKEREYVLSNLQHLIIKPAFPRFGLHPVFGAALSEEARRQLAARIQLRPEQYVAQEMVQSSTAPVWTDNGLSPRHMVLRMFAAWDGTKYVVMPGGLTRVSSSSASLVVSMQHGSGSKDTWVLGSGETASARQHDLLAHPARAAVTGDLPSRVADNLFWLGRYVERLEALIRMLRVLYPALSGEEDFGQNISLETAIHMLIGYQHLPKELRENSLGEQRRQLEQTLTNMVYDPAGMSGLGWNLKQIRRVAWPLKERLSSDTWRVLQQLELDSARPGTHIRRSQRLTAASQVLDRFVLSLSAFAGLLADSTTRGHGWRFLEIGRRLERAMQMTELLRHGIAATPPDPLSTMEMMLQVADSSITYRSRYLTELRAPNLLELLLTDETNPRSVAFQLSSLETLLEKLPEREGDRRPLERRLILSPLTAVRVANLEELCQLGEDGSRAELTDVLEQIMEDLVDLSEALTGKYLSHLMPSRLAAY
jgi:uncharacterized circularly permuted ATP-grasp superfamily protein/uncharacterized alpha-E superfamily protein